MISAMVVSMMASSDYYEVLKVGFPSSNGRVNVVLPGNPGLVSYYEDLATEMCRMTKTPVMVVGYLGFHSHPKRGRLPRFDLEDQIAHSRKIVEEVASEYDCVGLVGHSIGGLIVLECLRGNVDKVSLLMPFLAANDSNPSYISKKRLAAIPGLAKVLALVAFALSFFPRAIRTTVLRTGEMSDRCREITENTMILPSNIHEYVTMGKSEFVSPRILFGGLPDAASTTTTRFQFIYSKQEDVWVRPEDSEKMISLEAVETIFVDSPHDFPTRVESSRLCAELVAGFL